jgi:hypothetical protein
VRVLDLDLDFFLNRVSFRRPDGGRLDPERYIPWPEEMVHDVMRGFCGPSALGRPVGRTVTHHQEAFFFWRELVEAGEINEPFEVVHVDAHADLGMSNDGHRYIMGDLLHRPPDQRHRPNPEKLRAGNYLLFAAACRWLSGLTYLMHPHRFSHGQLIHDDRMSCHFRHSDPEGGIMELRCCDPLVLRFDPPQPFAFGRSDTPALALEPPIPFTSMLWGVGPPPSGFDMILLAHSPDYTPATADRLVAVIESFFEPV